MARGIAVVAALYHHCHPAQWRVTDNTDKQNSGWAPPPLWMDAILAWLAQLGIYSLLVGFSRGAAWSALLLKTCPTNIRGALLAGGYHCNESVAQQLQDARDLLKAKVPVVIVHAANDDHSNPVTHPYYWQTLLEAKKGDGIDENLGNLVIVTLKEPRYNHKILRTVSDGFATDPHLAALTRDSFTCLLDELDSPV